MGVATQAEAIAAADKRGLLKEASQAVDAHGSWSTGPSLATGEPSRPQRGDPVQLYGASDYRAKPDSGPPQRGSWDTAAAARALRWSDIFARMTKAAFEVGKGMRGRAHPE